MLWFVSNCWSTSLHLTLVHHAHGQTDRQTHPHTHTHAHTHTRTQYPLRISQQLLVFLYDETLSPRLCEAVYEGKFVCMHVCVSVCVNV